MYDFEPSKLKLVNLKTILSRLEKSDFLSGKTSENRRTKNVWVLFFAFFKRSAKFIKYMKNRKDREKFEIYLQTIGRDISVYKSEGWTEAGFKTVSDWLFLGSALIGREFLKSLQVKCIEYGH